MEKEKINPAQPNEIFPMSHGQDYDWDELLNGEWSKESYPPSTEKLHLGKYKLDGNGYYIQEPEGRYRPVDIIDGKIKPLTPAILEERKNSRERIKNRSDSKGYPSVTYGRVDLSIQSIRKKTRKNTE